MKQCVYFAKMCGKFLIFRAIQGCWIVGWQLLRNTLEYVCVWRVPKIQRITYSRIPDWKKYIVHIAGARGKARSEYFQGRFLVVFGEDGTRINKSYVFSEKLSNVALKHRVFIFVRNLSRCRHDLIKSAAHLQIVYRRSISLSLSASPA